MLLVVRADLSLVVVLFCGCWYASALSVVLEVELLLSTPATTTSNRGGRFLEIADNDNNATCRPVIESGLGELLCLGCEVYGRWGQPCIKLMEKLVRERSRLLHPRVRRRTALGLQHRWWGILSISLQKAAARAILRNAGADLHDALLEPIPGLADLAVVA